MATVNKDFVTRNGVTAGGLVKGTRLESTIATGTAPLTVASQTLVTNLNADLLDGNNSSAFGLVSGKLSQFASTTSSELAGVISDETGSGSLVFATSPTLVTPTLGVASATSINKVAITAPATSATLTIANGKTLTVSNTLTFTGTDSSSVAFGSGGTVAYTGGNLSQFAATTSAQLAGVISDETGSGALVFGTSPTFTTSVIAGSATMAVFNTTATTVNAFGAATTLSLGAGTGTTTVNNNLTVSGNLTVNGTTTTINSTAVTVDDPIFILGGDAAPTSDDNLDRGIVFRWHNGTAARLGFFGYDDSTGYFTFIPDATDTSGVISGTAGDIQATNFRGALIGNADTATTAGKWTTARTITLGGDLSGSVSIDGSAGVTLNATIVADAVALGTDTTGNYVATIAGTTNQVTVTGSGSENAAVTLSLPQNIHTAATPTFAGLDYANSANTSKTVTVSTNNTPTNIDSFAVATYTSAEYLIQMKQGTKMTTTKLIVMWDGTDVHVNEYGVTDATAGAANATISASVATGTCTVTASSSDAATTNVVIKSAVTYIKA